MAEVELHSHCIPEGAEIAGAENVTRGADVLNKLALKAESKRSKFFLNAAGLS